MHENSDDGIRQGTVARWRGNGGFECIDDDVAVEEPLEISVNGRALAITMRTPGHDEELAAGFLLAEGLLSPGAKFTVAEVAANALEISIPGLELDAAGDARRYGTISTSCGLCGKSSIDAIRKRFPPLPKSKHPQLKLRTLLDLPDRLRAGQGNFARTGGLHAAGIFDFGGELVVLREDVGRHNAVDKAIGSLFLRQRLPLTQHLLVVSGRASLEIVQKAMAAGLAMVASVSAPSTLAVTFARETGQTLIGFLRPPTFNVYSHVERLDPGAP